MRFGGDDDLVLGIDRGDAGVTLDDAFVGRHFGTVVVSAVALDHLATGAATVVGVCGKPRAQVAGIALQPLDLLGPAPAVVRLGRLAVGGLMSREQGFRASELQKIRSMIEGKRKQLLDAWNEYFG